ncbi:ribbon-helix-helix domain-containing protein [Aquisphaera insulae]|uniref:ribbon-helix-helix domain-containing protein n=1 Tax=Aquisphaera insulae TaxID=2712864 RepID=UPI00203002BD|nr:ribbon-helix-helix domain-containing protein [Aquisphaera insulae]
MSDQEEGEQTIHLPEDLASSLEAAVHSGHFATMDEAMAEGARLLLLELKRQVGAATSPGVAGIPAPVLDSIDAMQKDAELLDEIVADAYRRRREDRPREFVL